MLAEGLADNGANLVKRCLIVGLPQALFQYVSGQFVETLVNEQVRPRIGPIIGK